MTGIDFKELERQHKIGNVDFQILETIKAGVKFARVHRHPLDRYIRSETITVRQHNAGTKLYSSYVRSQIPASGSNYDGTPAPQTYFSRSVTDRQLIARDEYTRALLSLGPQWSLTLTDVVLNEMGLSQHASRIRRSERTAKRRLIRALDELADYYRLPEG